MTTCLKYWCGVALLGLALPASAAVLYVDLSSSNPTPPYANWTTAAANIQAAVYRVGVQQ
jgi:hypothetical protein